MAHIANGIPRSTLWKQPEQMSRSIEKALHWLRSRDEKTAGTCWSPRFPELERALQLRIFVIREEARDAVELAGVELVKARFALSLARNRGNPGQITRATNARAVALDREDMTRALWEERETWLSETRSMLEKVLPEERLTAVLRVAWMR